MSPFRTILPKRKPDPLLAQIRRIMIHGASWSTCLDCGSMNVLSNIICGRCGANLPRLLDEKGQVRQVPVASPSKPKRGKRFFVWAGILLVMAFGIFLIYRAWARSGFQFLD